MMTPQRIHECRQRLQHVLTAEGRRGHKPDKLISECLPEALDEVERLRQCIWDMCAILGMDTDGATDANVLISDIASLGINQAKMAAADYEECGGRIMTDDFNDEAAQHWETVGNRWLGACWANILLLIALFIQWVRTEDTASVWLILASIAFWILCSYMGKLYYGRAKELRSDHGKPPLP